MDEVIKAKIDITKGRSDAFEAAVRRLGVFIYKLDLNEDANNELVDLIWEQIRVAERDAFKFGFNMAAKLMHDHYSGEFEERGD